MALTALFDDFPVRLVANRRRPPMSIGFLGDDFDRRIGQVFRQLPALLRQLDSEENVTNGKQRKRKASFKSPSLYEPKSKVRVTSGGDRFQVSLDTSNYQPDEILVKVVDDKLAVSAKHETKRDDVYEFHEMYRCFDLPEGVDPNSVTSKLGADGQLTIEAPMVKPKELNNERLIPIERSKDCESPKRGEKDSSKSNE